MSNTDSSEIAQNKTAGVSLQFSGASSPRVDKAFHAVAVPVAGIRISTTDMQAPRRSKTSVESLPTLR